MELIKQYLDSTKLVSHHIRTFDELVTNGLQTILNRELPIEGINHTLTFGHVYVDTPKYLNTNRQLVDMYPNHARKQNTTYEGVVYANVNVTERNVTRTIQRVPIGKMPVMIKSIACNLRRVNDVTSKEECRNDPGGYFIVKGKERVLVGQLRPAYNRVYTFECKDKYTHYSEIRSMNSVGASVLIKAFIDSKLSCWFSLPNIKTILPAGLVFRALNVDRTELSNMLSFMIKNPHIEMRIMTQYDECVQDVMSYIAESISIDVPDKISYVKTILERDLFYHIGHPSVEKSVVHLVYILKRLAWVATGNLVVDSKHNLSNKRLDSTGNLLAFIFNGLFKQFVKSLKTILSEKKTTDPIAVIKSLNTISFGMSSCFTASNWTTQKSIKTYSREGVSQVLCVQNYGARLSHLRRIMLPNGVKGKNSAARLIHASHFSFICPAETPEGERVGLVSNLSLTVDVTVGIPSHVVTDVIGHLYERSYNKRHLVMINGYIVGSCDDAYAFIDSFDAFRRSDSLDSLVTIAWLRYANEIHIWSDEGRLVRPLLSLHSGSNGPNIPTNFNEGVSSGDIVFRDVLELEQAVVAMDEMDLKRNKCDYMEICPAATIMSVMGSVIPFYNHSQSPRNAYQASMGKQAIGIPCESFAYRYDTTLHVLNYVQQPITRSEMVNVLRFNEMCHGEMPIVAIMTFCGFNQEDSIILNKGSIDRGLFIATTYNTIVEEEHKRGNNDFEVICLPKDEYRRHDVNYAHLGPNGVVKNDSRIYLNAGDAIVGKTQNRMIKRPEGRSLETKDVSVTIKSGEEGYVDSVIDCINSDGVRVIKIRTRLTRTPEIGDKFASSTAQKGTCGMIFRQEDMPFDADGVSPDLVINPHAIPSRMTINMLIEQCLNLVGCRTGKFQDATAFAHSNIEQEIRDKMVACGFDEIKRQLYSGFTGERLPSKTFVAPAYYQRLKHMVSDKMHARMAGPLDSLTHQPVAGRARDGGLRFGNMEVDATIASGASSMVKEFMFEQSDKYKMCICPRCGQIPLNTDLCQTCNEPVTRKNTPYATKLFYQLLIASGIKVKIT